MPSTHTLSITALVISLTALTLAVVDFSISNVDPTSNAAAILLPTQTLAKTIHNPGTHTYDAALDYWVNSHPDDYTTYTHPTTGLAFTYLRALEITLIEESGGEIILAENAEYGMGFQIFIQPWDDAEPLTAERIRRELPDLTIDEILYAEILDTGMSFVQFMSHDNSAGPIAEAWIAYNGYLYQLAMRAPGKPDDLLLPWFRGFVTQLKFPTP